MKIENEFIPYEQSLELKHLGFEYISTIFAYDQSGELYTRDGIPHDFNIRGLLSAPTFSQAFRWFIEKYNLWNMIYPRDGWNYTIQEIDNIPSVFGQSYHNTEMKTYEEAELECLKKLIEIVKDGKK